MGMENSYVVTNWQGKCADNSNDEENQGMKETLCSIDNSLRRIAEILSGIESSVRFGNSEEFYEKHEIPRTFC